MERNPDGCSQLLQVPNGDVGVSLFDHAYVGAVESTLEPQLLLGNAKGTPREAKVLREEELSSSDLWTTSSHEARVVVM